MKSERLISADELYEKLMYGTTLTFTVVGGEYISRWRVGEAIENAPTVDAEPVRHGRWEWLGPNRLVTECMCGTCSACKVRSKYIVNTSICPNCGAKMDEE